LPAAVVLVAETVRVEVAVPPDGRLTLAGFTEPVKPVALVLVVRLMVPESPATLVTVTVDVPDIPG